MAMFDSFSANALMLGNGLPRDFLSLCLLLCSVVESDLFYSVWDFVTVCKTMLKLTIPRIKLPRNRKEVQLNQMRREIAKLLETGQEATARIKVEHITREEKMMAAQEMIELFCELITARLPIIEAQRECPLDLKEAISSLCFAAPRCADLTELLQVQILFSGKYGREFVTAATELMPECGVNRQLMELLSILAPAPDVKLKLLKQIAEEHELDWDPSANESELLKPHEDLKKVMMICPLRTRTPNEQNRPKGGDLLNYQANLLFSWLSHLICLPLLMRPSLLETSLDL